MGRDWGDGVMGRQIAGEAWLSDDLPTVETH
jgi:hypothetical protein